AIRAMRCIRSPLMEVARAPARAPHLSTASRSFRNWKGGHATAALVHIAASMRVTLSSIVTASIRPDEGRRLMSVRMILLPVFVHVAFVFYLLFAGMRGSTSTNRDGAWRDEISLAVLYYLLTLCAWHTQFADILFVVLAWIFVVLRILAGIGVGPAAKA